MNNIVIGIDPSSKCIGLSIFLNGDLINSDNITINGK